MPTTHRRLALGAAAVLLLASGAAPAVADDGHHRDRDRGHGGTLLASDVVGSLTSDPELFGVNRGGVDWTESRSTVRVRADGRVHLKVRDLLVTSTGVNPVPTLSASLVCSGKVVDTVGPVAYDTDGDARLRGHFTVPERCLAPAVLVHPQSNVLVYIAASGQAG